MNSNREIGTAWFGRHVVIIRCMPYTNQLIGMHTSLHAPTEPPSVYCAETLSQFFSIGYTPIGTYTVSASEVQYVLIK
ncbi:hypothetical protein ACOI1C_16960 [Bacillus sp. DJP31]|uniref:hypothetical protein n=1 Tax=Bacillus sp. DJP31 TaxID=3409789 RepID=UPI003BB71437